MGFGLLWIAIFFGLCFLPYRDTDKGCGADLGYRSLRRLKILTSLFWLGMVFKYGGIGPAWLRLHLTDLMMPLLIARGVMTLLTRYLPADRKTIRQQRVRFGEKLEHWRMGLLCGFFASIAFEAGSFGWSLTPFGRYFGLGGFAVEDFVCYALGTFYGCMLLEVARRRGQLSLIRQAGHNARRNRAIRKSRKLAARRERIDSLAAFRQEVHQRLYQAVSYPALSRPGELVGIEPRYDAVVHYYGDPYNPAALN